MAHSISLQDKACILEGLIVMEDSGLCPEDSGKLWKGLERSDGNDEVCILESARWTQAGERKKTQEATWNNRQRMVVSGSDGCNRQEGRQVIFKKQSWHHFLIS